MSLVCRRRFLRQSLSVIGAGTAAPLFAARPKGQRPRVAAILTEYRGYSHADVILGRFLQGYTLGLEGVWPRTQVVSMYVDQFPAGDLARGMAARYGQKITPTIEEALTLGGKELAVDGVLIIGEHGDYPENAKGQRMYPRRRFFEEVVKAFQKTNATAPVFNDKHLGFAWEDAKWMYDQARSMKFALMAGSSLPTTWRKPEIELPMGCKLEAALAVGYSDIEAYGFHTLETLQCMIERRAGGETGVRAVEFVEGPAVWRAAESGRWSRPLLDAVIPHLQSKPASGTPEERAKPSAFLIDYVDGLKAAALLLDGYSAEFGFAARVKDQPPMGSLFWLQEPGFGHFSYLSNNIETMFVTGEEPYPPERTLLTTGILDAIMTSRAERRRVETPWLASLQYQPKYGEFRRAKEPRG